MRSLDFTHHAGFSWYCILLMISGIALLVTAVLRDQTPQRRIIRAIFGIGFLGYGFYLAFIFGGGHYFVFFYAFLVPIWLIVDTVRSRGARRTLAQPPSPFGTSGGANGGMTG